MPNTYTEREQNIIRQELEGLMGEIEIMANDSLSPDMKRTDALLDVISLIKSKLEK